MNFWQTLGRACTATAAWFAVAAPVEAALAVLRNNTEADVVVSLIVSSQSPRPVTLAAGESRAIRSDSQPRLLLPGSVAGDPPVLEPDCAYKIVEDKARESLRLVRIPLGEEPGRPWTADERFEFAPGDAGVIKVKILVDDDELRTRQVWEPLLRKRIAAASAFFESVAGVRFEIVAVDDWDSNDLETDFSHSLAEFEREVSPRPGQVAIGFSSQYEYASGRVHMGGTRGALHSHILVKERARNVLETERLELLVHEMGHFLGATHSGDPTSVMRPVVGQGQLRLAGSRIQVDAPNALLMGLLGQEIRGRGAQRLVDLSPAAQRRMREIYAALAPGAGGDPATGVYQQQMNAAAVEPIVEDARRVLQHVTAMAKLQHGAGAEALAGDELLEFYVRHAALTATRLRPETRQRAFVLAMGFALDDTDLLQRAPLAGGLARQLEGEQQRRERVSVLGRPTMRGREDLAKHFFVSGTLVAMVGGEAARGAGLMKEFLDADGGSGFSFRDMAANRAGIVFAQAVLTGRLPLDEVARGFSVEQCLPPVDDLREALGAEEFYRDFGALGDQRLVDELTRIEQRIMALPVYHAGDAAPPP